MPQTIKNYRKEVKKFNEWFDALMVSNGYKKDAVKYLKPHYKVDGKDGAELLVALDIDDDANFRSIWLHIHAPSKYRNAYGREHHKHHTCIFQEHQPLRKGADPFPTPFMVCPKKQVTGWLAINYVKLKLPTDR